MTSSTKDDAPRRAILVAKLTENRFRQIDSRCAPPRGAKIKMTVPRYTKYYWEPFTRGVNGKAVEINSPLFRAIPTPFFLCPSLLYLACASRFLTSSLFTFFFISDIVVSTLEVPPLIEKLRSKGKFILRCLKARRKNVKRAFLHHSMRSNEDVWMIPKNISLARGMNFIL